MKEGRNQVHYNWKLFFINMLNLIAKLFESFKISNTIFPKRQNAT